MEIRTANKSPTTSTANSAVDSASAKGSVSEKQQQQKWMNSSEKKESTDLPFVFIAISLVCLFSSFFLVKQNLAEGFETILLRLKKKHIVNTKLKQEQRLLRLEKLQCTV